MRTMKAVELAPPRTVGDRLEAAAGYRPWLEVSVRVRVDVPAWSHREESWVRWAVPPRGQAWEVASARPFSPGRRGAVVGAPPAGLCLDQPNVDDQRAQEVLDELLRDWRPQLHHHPILGATSGLDEAPGSFRRRCLASLGELARRRGGAARKMAAEVAGLAAGIETRVLAGDEVAVAQARIGVGWYPVGSAPTLESIDLMVLSAARDEA